MMNRSVQGRLFVAATVVSTFAFQNAASAAQAQKAEPAHTVKASPSAEAKAEGHELRLVSIAMTVPAEWKSLPIDTPPGPMAPKAVFQVPNENGDPGMVRITYFPNMKGRDDMNIDRWLGQVVQPDGKPSTRENANIQTTEADGVKWTILDLSGTVKLTMRDTPKEGQRMIAAIVDHNNGPHFIVAAGPAELMAKSKDQVIGFIKSAKATD